MRIGILTPYGDFEHRILSSAFPILDVIETKFRNPTTMLSTQALCLLLFGSYQVIAPCGVCGAASSTLTLRSSCVAEVKCATASCENICKVSTSCTEQGTAIYENCAVGGDHWWKLHKFVCNSHQQQVAYCLECEECITDQG
ncbi:hypothetical protein O181_003240 [Austropuccinia psidii MF-1]|uniref:Uncharacterized protein n=1 Tax=Austropuccinia psidii MF-1 TaxID=1389203 RepID=A0A9Q3GDP5_9BASI|nr:hypothetical protein [Austropuccinia psidii MF-1]